MNRRKFITHTGLTLAVSRFAPQLFASTSRTPLFTAVGITAALDRAAELEGYGADYIVPTVADLLMPDKPDAEFAKMQKLAAQSPLPIVGCNSFLRHPSLRCNGPDADHPRVLSFSEIAFGRLAKLGGSMIGFGSNTSRQIPDDWPKERADEQFMELLSKMGPLAAEHGITVAIESQRTQECNYLNTINEVYDVVTPVNHPNIRILADFYHMAVMGDTPEDLKKAAPWVSLVEVAEKEERTVPGVMGDDFRPYMKSLAEGGYSGYISIEGNGNAEQLRGTFQEIKMQASDVEKNLDSYNR